MTENLSENAVKKRSRLGIIFAWIFGLVLALALLAMGLGYGSWLWLNQQFDAPGPTTENRAVILPRGAGLITIAQQLEAEGFVNDARLFRILVTVDKGDRNLRAGEFEIPASASMTEIYDILKNGETVQHSITFAEGLTSAMIVSALADYTVLTGDVTHIPEEGALLPETYMVDRNTSRQAVLSRMSDAQSALLDALWPNRMPDLPFSTRKEAIILASIVEKETSLPEERGLIAAVFIKRLKAGYRLQTDPTIIYGISQGEPLGRGIYRSEIDDASNLYNTYQINGLPPGPIANPGAASIRAVLNPPDSDYLYFVADGTGGHAFAETLQEHNRNVAQWRRIERQRRSVSQRQ